jgi:hypothetical protein
VTLLTFTVAVPVFVTVTVCVVLFPRTTLPKSMSDGVNARFPGAGATPMPVKLAPTGEVVPSFTNDTLPFAVPATVGLNVMVTARDAPPFKVAGVVIPFSAYPVPAKFAAVTLSGKPPVFVSTRFCVAEAEVVTFPKFSVPGATVSVGGLTPVPVALMVSGDTVPSFTNETEPEMAPVALGAKLMPIGWLAPAASVNGAAIPVTVRPAPLMLMAEMLIADPPVLLRVTGLLDVAPVATLPNASEEAVEVSVPGGAIPVPVSGTAVGELLASLTTLSEPGVTPVAGGVNVIVRTTVAFAAMVNGAVAPDTLYPDPLTFNADTVAVVPPVFVSESV